MTPLNEDEHNVWVQHPVTRIYGKDILEEMQRTLVGLLGAARTSDDAKVRGLSAKYHTLEVLLKNVFQEKHESPNQSEEPHEPG